MPLTRQVPLQSNPSISGRSDIIMQNPANWHSNGQFGYQAGEALLGATSVSIGLGQTPNGYIAVADTSTCQIKIFSGINDHPALKPKRVIDCEYRPLDVAVDPINGRCFVTDESSVVKVYDSKGKSLANLGESGNAAKNVKGDKTEVLSVTVDAMQRVIVGERVGSGVYRGPVQIMKNQLSVYNPDGRIMTRITIRIPPWFIAAAPTGEIIVSPDCNCENVHILDQNGRFLRELEPPTNMSSPVWWPSGVCCSRNGKEVFVANRDGDIGVFRFSMMTGEFRGCIPEADDKRPEYPVNIPRGMDVSKDGKTLLAADWASVKIFSLLSPRAGLGVRRKSTDIELR